MLTLIVLPAMFMVMSATAECWESQRAEPAEHLRNYHNITANTLTDSVVHEPFFVFIVQ